MGFDHPENMTRKTFLKGVAGAAVGCALVSLGGCGGRKSEPDGTLTGNSEEGGKVLVHLAAACGTYCGACPAYINKHSEAGKRFAAEARRDAIGSFVEMMGRLTCDGCLSGALPNVQHQAVRSEQAERCPLYGLRRFAVQSCDEFDQSGRVSASQGIPTELGKDSADGGGEMGEI
jgi:hypothetical protein